MFCLYPISRFLVLTSLLIVPHLAYTQSLHVRPINLIQNRLTISDTENILIGWTFPSGAYYPRLVHERRYHSSLLGKNVIYKRSASESKVLSQIYTLSEITPLSQIQFIVAKIDHCTVDKRPSDGNSYVQLVIKLQNSTNGKNLEFQKKVFSKYCHGGLQTLSLAGIRPRANTTNLSQFDSIEFKIVSKGNYFLGNAFLLMKKMNNNKTEMLANSLFVDTSRIGASSVNLLNLRSWRSDQNSFQIYRNSYERYHSLLNKNLIRKESVSDSKTLSQTIQITQDLRKAFNANSSMMASLNYCTIGVRTQESFVEVELKVSFSNPNTPPVIQKKRISHPQYCHNGFGQLSFAPTFNITSGNLPSSIKYTIKTKGMYYLGNASLNFLQNDQIQNSVSCPSLNSISRSTNFILKSSNFPSAQLGLIKLNSDRCVSVSGGVLSNKTCNILDKTQWWSRAANESTLKHYASQSCLIYNPKSKSTALTASCSSNASIDTTCFSDYQGSSFGYSLLKRSPQKTQAILTDTTTNQIIATYSFDSVVSLDPNNNILQTNRGRFRGVNADPASVQFEFHIRRIEGVIYFTSLSFFDGTTSCLLRGRYPILQTAKYLQFDISSCIGSSKSLQVRVSLQQVFDTAPIADREEGMTYTRISDTNYRVDGLYVNSSGPKLLNFILGHPNLTTLTFNNLPGSSDDSGLAYYAKFIRAAGLNTYLLGSGQAYSGGVDLFLAGVKRTVERGGILGVHSWSGGNLIGSNLPQNAPEHNLYIDYATYTLGSAGRNFYFFTLNHGESICKMTEAQMQRYNVVTEPIATPQPGTLPVTNPDPFCSN